MISAINSIAQKSSQAILAPSNASSTKTFEGMLQGLRQSSQDKNTILSGLDAHADLQTLQTQILSGKEFSPAELLRYQIVVSKFNLNVELVSKLAESLLASVRKLQNPQ